MLEGYTEDKSKQLRGVNHENKKTVSTVIALALVCLWVMPLQAQEALLPSGISEDEIGEKIEAFVAEHKASTTGLSVCVFKKDRILYGGTFGWIDVEKQIPVAQDSIFEWGSISKLTVGPPPCNCRKRVDWIWLQISETICLKTL